MSAKGHKANLALRPEVRRFADMMEGRLQQHETDRDDTWRLMTRADLAVHLRHAQQQFFDALAGHAPPVITRMAAADVANYIMFMVESDHA